jgi:hypothetical protein
MRVRGRPQRVPFPYDARIGTLGVMLGASAKGGQPGLVTTNPTTLDNVAPSDFSYQALPPEYGRIFSVEDLSGGYGCARFDEASGLKRYRYAEGADASTGYGELGPEITTLTPSTVDSTNGITGFFEIGGKLFALNGRYCHLRTSDADWNTSRKDFGSGKAALDSAVFYANNLSAQSAYVAMGETEPIYKFDGTTWTQHAEVSKIYARAFAVVGSEFYRAHTTNLMAKVDTDADPFVIANWSADNAWHIGDKSAGITRLGVTALGSIVAFKSDGIYTVDAENIDHPLFPFLKMANDTDGGKAVGAWLNDLYVTYRGGTFRVSPDWSAEVVGPERIADNDSPVRGRVTSLAGHGTHHLYAGLLADGGNGYLLKMGKDGAWHGSISQPFTSKTITAMYVSSIGAPTSHQRMYLGFSDGSVGWFVLPCTTNPRGCTSYRWTTVAGNIYYPRLTFGFGADQKVIPTMQVKGLLSPGSVTLAYRSDLATTWITAGSATASNFEDVDLPAATSATVLEVRATLANSATAATTVLMGVGIQHWLNVQEKDRTALLVLATENLIRRDGTPYRQVPATIKAEIEALRGGGYVAITLPTEEQITARVVSVAQSVAWSERLRKWTAALRVELAQETDQALYGTWARISEYTWAELDAMTWATIGRL